METSLGSLTSSFGDYEEIRKHTQEDDSFKANERCPVFLSHRWTVAHVCFWGSAAAIALRQDLSMALVCMFPEKGGGGSKGDNSTGWSDTGGANVSQESGIEWSDEIQGLLLSAHFYGYLISPMFGGYMAARYGGKQVLTVVMLVTIVATLLTPVTARYSPYAVLVLRLLIGLFTGALNPANQELLNRWMPSCDKNKLLSYSFAGGNVGNVIAFAFSGILCTIPTMDGWPFVFYVFGGASFLWVLWLLLRIHNSPEIHPRISEQEKHFILSGISTSFKKTLNKPPWRDVLTSLPLLSILLCHFLNVSCQIVFGTTLPLYMRDVLAFPVEQNGIMSSLLPLGGFVGMIICGICSDWLVKQRTCSLSVIRKCFSAVGFLVPAVCVFGLSFLDQSNKDLAVIILILSSTVRSAGMMTLRVNITDIAPRYSSVIVGAFTTVASIPGMIVPLGVTVLTANGTREEWQTVFFICTSLYVVTALTFLIFGSAEEQDWAKHTDMTNDERQPLVGNKN